MKVLFITHHFKAGGVQRQLVYLMRELLERGITLSLFVFNPVGEFLDQIPNEIKVYLPKSPPPRIKRPVRDIWRLKEIIQVLLRENPDLIYCRLWPTKAPAVFASQLFRKKVILAEASSLVSMGYEDKSRMNVYLRKTTCRLADVVVAVSQGVANELEQLFGLSPSKIKVIYNGLDIEDVGRKSKEEVSHPWFGGADPIAIAVGRLVNQKGFGYLFEAVELVNRKTPLRLIIIGDGKLREELRGQIQQLGIGDKVDLIGVKKNPFAYMARSDLFVLSSLYEGFPNVLIEAMALGLPVISTDCPHGPSEIIEDGRSGILVPVADPQAISEAILRVLADEQLKHRLSVEARTRATDFSLENMISNYTELFLSLSGRI